MLPVPNAMVPEAAGQRARLMLGLTENPIRDVKRLALSVNRFGVDGWASTPCRRQEDPRV